MIRVKTFCFRSLLVLGFAATMAFFPNAVHAGIVGTGDVVPDVDYWDESTYGVVGYDSSGTVTVNAGSDLVSYNGSLGGCEELLDFEMDGGTGTMTITGNGSTWTMDDDLAMGYCQQGRGILNIQEGGSVDCGRCFIGFYTDSAGTVTVDGTNSALNVNGGEFGAELQVGYYGQGTLNIQNDGVVTVAGATMVGLDPYASGAINFANGGSLTTTALYAAGSDLTGTGVISTHGVVSDVDVTFSSSANTSFMLGNITMNLDMSNSSTATDLGVGYAGAGSLAISGCTVHSQQGFLGYGTGSSGTATVSGADAVWLADSLSVGQYGHGTLMVANGGSVSTNFASITGDNSEATVDNATWTNGSDLWVGGGYATIATLEIKNGGAVTTDVGSIGYALQSCGTVTVTGAGSSWTIDSELYVGRNGFGDLYISDGGSVTVGGTTYVGYSGCQSVINFSNGTLSTKSLVAANAELTGTGSIETRGIIGDVDLTFDSTASLSQSIPVSGSNVIIALNMSNTNDVGDLGIGYQDTGSLMIQNGVTVCSRSGYLAHRDGSTGAATVTGADSAWNIATDLFVGNEGTATLNIQNGGVVSVAGTTYAGVGVSSYGTVAFGGTGGTLSTKNLYLNRAQFTGAGVVEAHGVTGNVNLTFDDSGQTTMALGGSVVLNLDMSDSNNAGDLCVGYSGAGSLVIQNGATVYSAATHMAYQDGSSATATVTGNSVWSSSGAIYVGGYGNDAVGGTATLNITDGGMVSAAAVTQGASFNMGGWYGPVGVVNLDGGILQAKESTSYFMYRLQGAYIHDDGATIDTNGHDITISQALLTDSVSTGGGLTKTGDGTMILSGANTYTGRTVVEAGTLNLAADAQAAVLTGGGADIQNGKMLFDYVSGSGFPPPPPSAPDVLTPLTASYTGGTAPWTTGQFLCSTTGGTDTSHGLGWKANPNNGYDGQVIVMYTLYGDSNLDGSVNGTDLNAVLSYYNQSTDPIWGSQIWAHGDFNYDGSVNGTDLNTVLSNYNQSLSSSTAAVPEPSTMLLLVLGLLGLLAWRKRFGIC